eukprot:Skav236019  [mRNA]  locus=scaffold1524:21654:23362:- [translate_table: standard]
MLNAAFIHPSYAVIRFCDLPARQLAKMGKKAGYIDPDDERLKVGQKKLVEVSAKWKGPSHKERETNVKKAAPAVGLPPNLEAMKRGATKPEKASWKQQAAGWFFIMFICGVGFISFLFTMSDVIVGNGIVQLDVQDTAKLKTVLFGGEPWLIYCVNAETENYRLPKVLEESARSLWRSLGLSVGVLKCWEETSSGRSVAQRFKLGLRPPLSFVVANGNKPKTLKLTGISKADDLEKRIRPALALEIVAGRFWNMGGGFVRIDALKKWTGSCTSCRSCAVIGHKNQAQRDTATNVLKPLQSKFRSVQMVTVDTSFWQLKLEEGVVATRNKRSGGADVLCLVRDDVPGGNSTFGGTFLDALDAGSAKVFLQSCLDHSGQVPMKKSPKIKARPSKPKKVTAPSPKPPAPSKAAPAPSKAKKGSVDQVGSRETLESEEPLFEAVEGDEEEEEEEAEEDEVEL